MKKVIPSAWEFIKRAKNIYVKRENFLYLTKVNLAGILVSFVILIPTFVFSEFGQSMENGNFNGIPIYIIFYFLFSIVASIVWGLWFKVALIKAVSLVVNEKTFGVKETFKDVMRRVWPYALISFLLGLAIIFGFILLIVPGVIMAVWYSLSSFIVVVKEIKVREALRESKALVNGYFWQVLGRGLAFLVFYFVLEIALSSVPYIGPFVVLFISPYFVLLPYLMYEELLKITPR